MNPYPDVNRFLCDFGSRLPQKIVNRSVDRAFVKKTNVGEMRYHEFLKLDPHEPQCFAPNVDETRARLAYGPFELPMLKRDLSSSDPLVVRQAVTSLCDVICDPVKLVTAIEKHIPTKLGFMLQSEDPYVRERVAMIFGIVAHQACGIDAMLKNLTITANLLKGFDDRYAIIRMKMANAVEVLSCDLFAAQQLSICGFIESIIKKLPNEKKDILIVHLKTLRRLLEYNDKERAMKLGAFEKLVSLLSRKTEEVLQGALSCLVVLCSDRRGKKRAIELDLLATLRPLMLEEDRVNVIYEAVTCAGFISITTRGKLRLMELETLRSLLQIAFDKCSRCRYPSLLLAIIKLLTNLAETPQGRKIMLEEYLMDIKKIDTADSDELSEHLQFLIDTIEWKP